METYEPSDQSQSHAFQKGWALLNLMPFSQVLDEYQEELEIENKNYYDEQFNESDDDTEIDDDLSVTDNEYDYEYEYDYDSENDDYIFP